MTADRAADTVRCVIAGIGADRVDYQVAWAEQRRLHAAVVDGGEPGTVLLLEHPPVYTAGKRTEPHERPVDGTPVVDVDRGGKITWHGPGQLVGYPIVRLPSHVFVVDYVRRVEEALIRVCRELGVTTAARVRGRSGVWLPADSGRPERKIAALGIRVAHGVTMHGFALNCDPELSWFDRIVPCGITDAGVTSLSAELGHDVTVNDVLDPVRRYLGQLLSWSPYDQTPDIERPEPPTEPSAAASEAVSKAASPEPSPTASTPSSVASTVTTAAVPTPLPTPLPTAPSAWASTAGSAATPATADTGTVRYGIVPLR